jgi:hypothetical protein
MLSLVLLLSMLHLGVFAQTDYYKTYSGINLGLKPEDGGQTLNAKLCRVRLENNTIMTYTPYEVSEYGFKDGRVFRAREIRMNDTIKRVFLELLVKGKMNLYFYKGLKYRSYYLEKDSGELIPLPKDGKNTGDPYFRNILDNATHDCAKLTDHLNLINYRTKTLSSYVEAYNTCKAVEFPYFKYGIMAGFETTTLLIPSSIGVDFLKDNKIESDESFTISLFMDYPIGKKGLSFHPEFQFVRNNFKYHQYNYKYEATMVINTICINFPLMIRYTVPISEKKFRPYVNAGFVASFLLKNESLILETTIKDEVIISDKYYRADLLGDQYAGYITGAGVQFNIHHRLNLFAELRYGRSYAFLNNTLLNKRECYLLTGINF